MHLHKEKVKWNIWITLTYPVLLNKFHAICDSCQHPQNHVISIKLMMRPFSFLLLMNYILTANWIIQPSTGRSGMFVWLGTLHSKRKAWIIVFLQLSPCSPELSSHIWVTAPYPGTFPCPSCWCLIPCGTSSSPVVSVPVQYFQLGAASAFCPTHYQSCPCGASYPMSREQRDFSWDCHKEKSKNQVMDVHFDLPHRGK